MKAAFTPLKIGLTEISRSRFKQYNNQNLIYLTAVWKKGIIGKVLLSSFHLNDFIHRH